MSHTPMCVVVVLVVVVFCLSKNSTSCKNFKMLQFLKIYTIFNVPVSNYKTRSTYLI